MDQTERPDSVPPQQYLSVRQAAFIGVGAMVGAGIFAPFSRSASASTSGGKRARGSRASGGTTSDVHVGH
jgi:hypothetical protein